MRPLDVVVPDPRADHLSGMAQALEVVQPDSLLLEAPDEPPYQPVLLRRVRGDELLLQPIGPHRGRVVLGAENKRIVRTQGKRMTNPPKHPEPMDQRLLQRRLGRLGIPRPGQSPARHLPRAAVEDDSERAPPVPPAPDIGQIRRPAPVRYRRHQGQRPCPGPMPPGCVFSPASPEAGRSVAPPCGSSRARRRSGDSHTSESARSRPGPPGPCRDRGAFCGPGVGSRGCASGSRTTDTTG